MAHGGGGTEDRRLRQLEEKVRKSDRLAAESRLDSPATSSFYHDLQRRRSKSSVVGTTGKLGGGRAKSAAAGEDRAREGLTDKIEQMKHFLCNKW